MIFFLHFAEDFLLFKEQLWARQNKDFYIWSSLIFQVSAIFKSSRTVKMVAKEVNLIIAFMFFTQCFCQKLINYSNLSGRTWRLWPRRQHQKMSLERLLPLSISFSKTVFASGQKFFTNRFLDYIHCTLLLCSHGRLLPLLSGSFECYGNDSYLEYSSFPNHITWCRQMTMMVRIGCLLL